MGNEPSKPQVVVEKPRMTPTGPYSAKLSYSPPTRDPEPNIPPAPPGSVFRKRPRSEEEEEEITGKEIDFSEEPKEESDDEEENFKANDFYRESKRFGPADLYNYTLNIVRVYNSKLVINVQGQSPTLKPGTDIKYFAGFFLQLQALTYNFMNNKKRNKKRNLWEKSGASEQCKKIIGETNQETTCWLCGFHKDELPEEILEKSRRWDCEHLLPVSAALLFLDVPHSAEDYKKPIYDYKLNYEWAHSICNNFKSSFLFADIFVKDSLTLLDSPQINERYIQLYLAELYNILKLKINKDDWISQRQVIIKEKFERLITYISEIRKKEIPTLFNEFNIRDSRIKKIISSIDNVFQTIQKKDIDDYVDADVYKAFLKQRDDILWLNPLSICKYPDYKNIVSILVQNKWITPSISGEISLICNKQEPKFQGGKKTRKNNKLKRKRTKRNKKSKK